MPYLEKHGIGSSNLIVPLMSTHELRGRIVAISDKYYLEVIEGALPYVLKKRDRKTHKVVSSVNIANSITSFGRGVLSGNFYIGSYRNTDGSWVLAKVNISTGLITTGMGFASYSSDQPIGVYGNGFNYFLKNGTTILKYDNSGNEVMTITTSAAANLLGVNGDKLYHTSANGGFTVLNVNTGAKVGEYIGNLASHILWNPTFLKNGDIIVCAKYSDSSFRTLLLQTSDGVNYTLKATLLNYWSPIMIDSSKEWFYVCNTGATRIVDSNLNTLIDNPIATRVYTPYVLADKKDKFIYANRVSVFNSQPQTDRGAIITKGVIV